MGVLAPRRAAAMNEPTLQPQMWRTTDTHEHCWHRYALRGQLGETYSHDYCCHCDEIKPKTKRP